MRRIISFIFAAALIITACVSSASAVGKKSVLDQENIAVYVDGVNADPAGLSCYIEDELYVPLETVGKGLGGYFYTWNSALRTASLMADGTFLTVSADKSAIVANGWSYHMDHGLQIKNGTAMVPASHLCNVFGAVMKTEGGQVDITPAVIASAPAQTEDYEEYEESEPAVTYTESYGYDSDDLYWLSHIIYAEAGGESYEGMVAVGNVVMNRVRSDSFPNNIYDVIFQQNQFEPVDNGSVYNEPSADAISAAEDALAGMNVVGDALYFNMYDMTSWADNNRPFLMQIGCHNFYL